MFCLNMRSFAWNNPSTMFPHNKLWSRHNLADHAFKLEEAASTLGASSVKVFIFVTLPLSLPGILAGAVVGFAKALGEFGATITFVSNIPGETQTIASAIYALLQVPGQEAAVGRMIGFSILLSFGALLLSEVLARRMVRR